MCIQSFYDHRWRLLLLLGGRRSKYKLPKLFIGAHFGFGLSVMFGLFVLLKVVSFSCFRYFCFFFPPRFCYSLFHFFLFFFSLFSSSQHFQFYNALFQLHNALSCSFLVLLFIPLQTIVYSFFNSVVVRSCAELLFVPLQCYYNSHVFLFTLFFHSALSTS